MFFLFKTDWKTPLYQNDRFPVLAHLWNCTSGTSGTGVWRELGFVFSANQSFQLSMKYNNHWMKGEYKWTENHEKRLIYLWNSTARDLRELTRARVRHSRPSAWRFQTAYAFFTHSCSFPSENKGLLQGITRFSVTCLYHHLKAYYPNRNSITPKVLEMDCLILSSGII